MSAIRHAAHTDRAAARHARLPLRPQAPRHAVRVSPSAARHARGLPSAWALTRARVPIRRLVRVAEATCSRSWRTLETGIAQAGQALLGSAGLSGPLASASRLSIAAILVGVTIVGPATGAGGLISPEGTATAAALDLPRGSAGLRVVGFRAIQADAPTLVDTPREFLAAQPVPVDAAQLAQLRAQAQVVAAAQQRAALPGCSGKAPTRALTAADNGRLDTAQLCELTFAPGKLLRADAAVALARLDSAYLVAFGHDLCIGDTYRSYDEQVLTKARKPGLAARPGFSNHGWALAVDLCDGAAAYDTPEYTWLMANAASFGWSNPDWARRDGKGPDEPWHWEYTAAVADQRAQVGFSVTPAPGN